MNRTNRFLPEHYSYSITFLHISGTEEHPVLELDASVELCWISMKCFFRSEKSIWYSNSTENMWNSWDNTFKVWAHVTTVFRFLISKMVQIRVGGERRLNYYHKLSIPLSQPYHDFFPAFQTALAMACIFIGRHSTVLIFQNIWGDFWPTARH